VGRAVPALRLKDLVEAATRVFIAEGYRRTQMADVAEAMGVAKGTVYLYVESKEALFDLVLRHAAGSLDLAAVTALPHPTPDPGAAERHLHERLAERDPVPARLAAFRRRNAATVRTELGEILRDLYGVLSRNRVAIKLVDRCSHDHPQLASVWFHEGRERELERLTRYLEAGVRAKALRPLPDVRVAARTVLETVTFWAVHRFWDPSPQTVDDKQAEDTVVEMLLGALLEE
jgi:AcrR family transcriptional regulator